MSQARARKQLKRLRRRAKRQVQRREQFGHRMHLGELPEEAEVIRLLSYDITEEAMPGPGHGGTQIDEVLGADEREKLFRGAQEDPQSVIPRLRELVERHPDVPVLYNWLSVAYQA